MQYSWPNYFDAVLCTTKKNGYFGERKNCRILYSHLLFLFTKLIPDLQCFVSPGIVPPHLLAELVYTSYVHICV